LLSVAVMAGAITFILGLQRFERDNLALRESQAKALEANQAKSEFLAAMSHELRTPLTSIRGFAELMEQRLEDDRFKRQAGLIRKGAEHLSKLVTEILDLSKVEAGAMQLDQETLDLPALIEGTADFFSLSASNKGLDLRVHMAPGLPLHFQGDALRLKQILNNLLSNAIKFTEMGAITLSVEAQGDKLAFHVDDSGPGIPVEAQGRIFEKFRQGSAHVSSEHGGTGLGLALSRGLAELMGGTLTVSSTVGQGARFTLLLPMQGVTAAA
jgi:signal transduction histidine kinase